MFQTDFSDFCSRHEIVHLLRTYYPIWTWDRIVGILTKVPREFPTVCVWNFPTVSPP